MNSEKCSDDKNCFHFPSEPSMILGRCCLHHFSSLLLNDKNSKRINRCPLWIKESDFRGIVVKFTCSNESCKSFPFMHAECCSWIESCLASHISGVFEEDMPKSTSGCHAAVWSRKSYDMIYKLCKCSCGSGFLRRDINWSTGQSSTSNNAQHQPPPLSSQGHQMSTFPMQKIRSCLSESFAHDAHQISATGGCKRGNNSGLEGFNDESSPFLGATSSGIGREDNTQRISVEDRRGGEHGGLDSYCMPSNDTGSTTAVNVFSNEVNVQSKMLNTKKSTNNMFLPMDVSRIQHMASQSEPRRNSSASYYSNNNNNASNTFFGNSPTVCNNRFSEHWNRQSESETSRTPSNGGQSALDSHSMSMLNQQTPRQLSGKPVNLQVQDLQMNRRRCSSHADNIYLMGGDGAGFGASPSSTGAQQTHHGLSSNNNHVQDSSSTLLKCRQDSGGSIFAKRGDYSAFNILPWHKINSYHIKMEDEGSIGNDETRIFILSSYAQHGMASVPCVICTSNLIIYDKYPLINGTFFLSPRQYSSQCIKVKSESQTSSTQKVQYLTAICMGCLESWPGHQIRCLFCCELWNGSHFILGTMYSYDIFAALPCCSQRLKCLSCSHFVIHPDQKSAGFFSDYSQMVSCPNCGSQDAHFCKHLSSIFTFINHTSLMSSKSSNMSNTNESAGLLVGDQSSGDQSQISRNQ